MRRSLSSAYATPTLDGRHPSMNVHHLTCVWNDMETMVLKSPLQIKSLWQHIKTIENDPFVRRCTGAHKAVNDNTTLDQVSREQPTVCRFCNFSHSTGMQLHSGFYTKLRIDCLLTLLIRFCHLFTGWTKIEVGRGGVATTTIYYWVKSILQIILALKSCHLFYLLSTSATFATPSRTDSRDTPSSPTVILPVRTMAFLSLPNQCLEHGVAPSLNRQLTASSLLNYKYYTLRWHANSTVNLRSLVRVNAILRYNRWCCSYSRRNAVTFVQLPLQS